MYPKEIKIFAESGDRNSIPDNQEEVGNGQVSWSDGFPQELSSPFNVTGKAIKRADMNGILHDITAFQVWQQKGGMFNWKADYTYEVPAIVYYNNQFWQCLNNCINIAPGSNATYWKSMDYQSAINNINNALAGKANNYHTQDISTINNLAVGAHTFSASTRAGLATIYVNVSRDHYGRLNGLSMSATGNCDCNNCNCDCNCNCRNCDCSNGCGDSDTCY